jgi:GT2 family glycosyltransferase
MFVDSQSASGGRVSFRCVVAIPAKDEVERLPACLDALARQTGGSGASLRGGGFAVVLFANNCRDGTAELARKIASRLPYRLHIIEEDLSHPFAHAGEARGRAMDAALALLAESPAVSPVILTTDADSRVGPNWIDANLAAIDAGADAVLGRLALDEEGLRLPLALHQRGALEDEYECLLVEMNALLDPVAWNPWPHHATVSGASIAIAADVYRAIGGLPKTPVGEDKALIAELLRHGARIRYSNEIEVITSARLQGRAPGGVADTLRLRSERPDAACDESLEPYAIAERRAAARGRLRRLLGKAAGMENLGHSRDAELRARKSFARSWSLMEAADPLLQRQTLRPADLPREIAAAQTGLKRLQSVAVEPSRELESTDGN